jgi:hypothetical protein
VRRVDYIDLEEGVRLDDPSCYAQGKKSQFNRIFLASHRPQSPDYLTIFYVTNYVTWLKLQNNISKQLNRNDNENKMYSAIDVPFIEWGTASYWLRQRNAIRRYHMSPLSMIQLPLA